MRTLYLECAMGAAGDMITAALLELHPDREDFLRRFNGLGLPGVELRTEPAARCGILGTRAVVTVQGQEEASLDVGQDQGHGHSGHDHDHHHRHSHHHHHDHGHHHDQGHDHCPDHHHDHSQGHHHRSMAELRQILEGLELPEAVKANSLAVFGLIAEAEARAHGRPVEEIHFHEVGTLDAIADVTTVSWLLQDLAPERILASPVAVGSGHVRCAHGILPVPAPATAWILRDVPVCGGPVKAELCTPTGAALLKHFVSSFGPLPVMTVSQIGYGMGAKDFEAANCLRALMGQS